MAMHKNHAVLNKRDTDVPLIGSRVEDPSVEKVCREVFPLLAAHGYNRTYKQCRESFLYLTPSPPKQQQKK